MTKQRGTAVIGAPASEPGGPLRVRATRRGQYGNVLRRVGDVFDVLSARDFSAHWMVVVEATTPLVMTTARAAIRLERAPVPLAGWHPPPPASDADGVDRDEDVEHDPSLHEESDESD
jgi:hypothetical protein